MENVQLSVSDFVAIVNQTLEYAYPTVQVVGEVAGFKISQGKWVNFKIKDDDAMVDCFMTTFQLRQPIEDGMKIMVVAAPRLNARWGKFSLNVRMVQLVGEGSIKKSFELLKAKLDAEGLFSSERKRPLPRMPKTVGVIASTESAGYADFCKQINDRWGGMSVMVAHVQVQGDPAADQMIRAVKYFNNLEDLPEVLVIIRGGGSAEDLMPFNDELLAREIAGSRIPTLVGVGHEIDHTLADMVADRRAMTPTNAAEILVPSKRELINQLHSQMESLQAQLLQSVERQSLRTREQLNDAYVGIVRRLDDITKNLSVLKLAMAQLNPENVLKRGYALLRGQADVGKTIEIETYELFIEAEVQNVRPKK